jgi:P27 family predicted phage terminase small subunit
MSTAGRKPIPDEIKQIKGTLRGDRSNKNQPSAEPLLDLPVAPDWMNEWAKDEWYTVVTWLHSIGLLSAIDISIIASYCQQMGIYREAEAVMKNGNRVIVTEKGYEMPSPWVAIGNKALMLGLKIATEYGLTPSSRSRITIPKQKKEQSGLRGMLRKKE